MMNPKIRHAMPVDAGEVARLNVHVQGWHAAHYPETFFASPDPAALIAYFRDRLSDPSVTCLLAGDPALGYALCGVTARPLSLFSPPIRRLMVEHIAVAPEARRCGIGAGLLAEARVLAREKGCAEVMLDTWEANHEAHAFFEANGFAVRRMLYRALP